MAEPSIQTLRIYQIVIALHMRASIYIQQVIGVLKRMTPEQVNLETLKHISQVRRFLKVVAAIMLLERGEGHDESKLHPPEVDGFAEFTPKLATSTYYSEEYKQFLQDMEPFLKHHYANNRHHPEHFQNGVDDMNLIDIVEMLCDWKAATLRHNDGDILRSIESNAERFNISPQLVQVFKNTAVFLGWV